jgi:VanZ family protein
MTQLSERLRAAAFWLPLGICTWLALTPSPPQEVFRLGDVVLHAFAFVYLSFALAFAHLDRRFGVVALALLGYGALIEVLQGFTATRAPEFGDLLVDAGGIVFGCLLYSAIGAPLRRFVERWFGNG